MKFLVALLLLISANSLSASITLTTPFSVPANGGTSIAAQSLSTVACQGVAVDILNGVASDVCYFCNDTTSAGKEVSCTQIPNTDPIFLRFVHATCVLTISFQGRSWVGATYGTTACSSAWTFDTTQTAAAVQNATELLLLPFNATTNPSGLGVFPGGGAQNATW